MSDDLIRRSDAIKAINPSFWTGLAKKIEAIPSVEPKRGEWITCWDAMGENEDGYKCTKCSGIAEEKFAYCPNCGARMKGADDDSDNI